MRCLALTISLAIPMTLAAHASPMDQLVSMLSAQPAPLMLAADATTSRDSSGRHSRHHHHRHHRSKERSQHSSPSKAILPTPTLPDRFAIATATSFAARWPSFEAFTPIRLASSSDFTIVRTVPTPSLHKDQSRPVLDTTPYLTLSETTSTVFDPTTISGMWSLLIGSFLVATGLSRLPDIMRSLVLYGRLS